jgi:hypothetical protein
MTPAGVKWSRWNSRATRSGRPRSTQIATSVTSLGAYVARQRWSCAAVGRHPPHPES